MSYESTVGVLDHGTWVSLGFCLAFFFMQMEILLPLYIQCLSAWVMESWALTAELANEGSGLVHVNESSCILFISMLLCPGLC